MFFQVITRWAKEKQREATFCVKALGQCVDQEDHFLCTGVITSGDHLMDHEEVHEEKGHKRTLFDPRDQKEDHEEKTPRSFWSAAFFFACL